MCVCQLHSTATFIEPMLLMATEALPEGAEWANELKLDGYRALAFKSDGKVHLRSRNNKSFDRAYPAIVKALAGLPDETVIDGEVVALDESGRPSFNALQNSVPGARIVYFVFDVLILAGRSVMGSALSARRELLARQVLPKLTDPIREVPRFDAALADLTRAVREQGLEGLVAKRLDGVYETGQRSGAWRKMRINRSAEFVIGGYTTGGRTFDAIILGYYEGDRLIYFARTRSGFTPAVRARLMEQVRPLKTAECPFANLPEARSGRWGEGSRRTK